MSTLVDFNRQKLADFCRRNSIWQLALFGSVLRNDFNDQSDVDVLVQFMPEKTVGLIRLAGMERELSEIIGHKVDLRTPADLSRYFRDEVVRSAKVLYEER